MKNENNLVYLYGFSGQKHTKLKNFLAISKKQVNIGTKIKVILIHDGVIGISKKGEIHESLMELINLPLSIYAIIPDLKARGINLDSIHDKVQLIDYEDLVDILAETHKIISWL